MPETGTFLSRDAWTGNILWPKTLNGWNYAQGDPIKNIDPSGYCIDQYSGEIRMGQYPYGTSGVCPPETQIPQIGPIPTPYVPSPLSTPGTTSVIYRPNPARPSPVATPDISSTPIPPALVVGNPPIVIVVGNSCVEDVWMAFSRKGKPGKFDIKGSVEGGVTVGKGVEVTAGTTCSYGLFSGRSCQNNVKVEGGAIVQLGYEHSFTSEGQQGKVYVQGDVVVANVELGAGSSGMSIKGGVDVSPLHSIGVELEALPPYNPSFPWPQFIGITLSDAYFAGGVQTWVSQVEPGTQIDGFVTADIYREGLEGKLTRLLRSPCFGLDVYEEGGGAIKHFAYRPRYLDQLLCSPK